MVYTKYRVTLFSKSVWIHIFPTQTSTKKDYVSNMPNAVSFYLAYISFCILSFWLVTLTLRISNLVNHHKKTRQQHIRHSYTRIHLTKWQVHCTRAREQLCSFYVLISVMPHSPQGVSWVEGSSNNFCLGVGIHCTPVSRSSSITISFQVLVMYLLNVMLLWKI